ncbi:hypothetical protein AWJ14_04295 [Hoeflea olei]|uniref:Uncharacterized protein n=2 Tax=Hoeflea olei TaxID=1480615 RepID=A0A1C1YZV0_9HYPH|nr:hypothetical protein AWJ14_04295 [Hoeflea olei]
MFLALAPGAALANSSAYTDLDPELAGCETIASDIAGGTWKCEGYRDYPVYFKEGDLRASVFFGHVAQVLIEDGFESFGPFNSTGKKIEWRLDDSGKPIAAILRYFVSDPETAANGGQVLVVSRVAQADDGLSCVVGYVDARSNDNANELARRVADQDAADFACGYTEAAWYGERGALAAMTSSHLPESLRQE